MWLSARESIVGSLDREGLTIDAMIGDGWRLRQ